MQVDKVETAQNLTQIADIVAQVVGGGEASPEQMASIKAVFFTGCAAVATIVLSMAEKDDKEAMEILNCMSREISSQQLVADFLFMTIVSAEAAPPAPIDPSDLH